MENLNLIIVLLMLAVVINAILSAILFSRGLRNIFNILFGLISFGVAIWCIAIAGFYSETLHLYTDWLAWTHSSALFIALIFLYFSNVFPERLIKGKLFYTATTLPFLAVLYYLFSGHAIVGKITGLEYEIGSGYIYYQILLIAYFLVGYCLLFLQYRRNKEPIRRQQIKYILIGSITASVLGMITDLIFPFLNIFNYTWLGPIFTVILVASIFIAILRHNLFNIKVIITELFSLVVLVTLIVDAFSTGAENILILGIKSIALIVITIFLYLFIRGVYKTENLAKKLGVANERLKELDALKTEFISFATHQLRAPITAIKGYTSEILEGDFGSVPDNLKSPAEVIMESSSSLAVLVDDYLNVSRIEQGKMKYEFSDFNLDDLVNEVANEQRPSVEKKGLKLESASPADKVMVHADRGKIKQVIMNLLDNAVKYTPAGQIIIALAKQDGKARLSVRDTGAGIKPETMSHLFQKFSRASDASKYNLFGTGLGLYLASELLKAHNGKIWAESEGDGKGSTFFVELPVE